jgi:hypothetical protein
MNDERVAGRKRKQLVFPTPFHALDARSAQARDHASAEMTPLRSMQRARVAHRFSDDRGPQNAHCVFDFG